MTNTEWLTTIMATFPTPGWTPERIQVYLDAMAGAEPRHVTAAVNRIIRGGWRSDFAPVAPTVRLLVDEIAREERDQRAHDARQARNRADQRNVAPPWHALLWSAVFIRLQGRQHTTDELRPYLAIVDEYGLTPEHAGAFTTPMGMAIDDNAVQLRYHQAVKAAEAVWVASGSTETAEAAALRAIGGMAGTAAA